MFKSKAILTALADTLFGSLILFSHYFFPEWEDFIIKFWAIWQPFIIVVIGYFASEPIRAWVWKFADDILDRR